MEQEIFCPTRIVDRHNEYHAQQGGTANRLMPHLAGRVFEPQSCVMAVQKQAEDERGLSLTAPDAPTCQQIGRCILNE